MQTNFLSSLFFVWLIIFSIFLFFWLKRPNTKHTKNFFGSKKGPKKFVQLFLVISGAVWAGSNFFKLWNWFWAKVFFSNSLENTNKTRQNSFLYLEELFLTLAGKPRWDLGNSDIILIILVKTHETIQGEDDLGCLFLYIVNYSVTATIRSLWYSKS